METSASSYGHTFTDSGIPIAGDVEDKEELKTCYSGVNSSFM